MILRRLAEGVRNQDWFTVVVEVLIVVVGIFLGLQVDDWNEARKDRAAEQEFLNRLHDDVLNAEALANRLLARRLTRQQTVFDLVDLLFEIEGQRELTDEQCLTLTSLHYFNIAISDLTAAVELSASGRMHILRDDKLRIALAELQQARLAAGTYIQLQNAVAYDLAHLYPELIRRQPFLDANNGEVRSRSTCDLTGMLANPRFMNDASNNFDTYDAYIRDAIAPWSKSMVLVHQLIDQNLNLAHEANR